MRNPCLSSGPALRLALWLRPWLCSRLGLRPRALPPNPNCRSISVTETRLAAGPNLPNSTASKTAQELEAQNIFNPEDAASLLPSTTVRKRYLSDRNANIGGRSFGTLQPGRALVYLDGYLISNFLGRFDALRWNMINVEAIERVDALYGPYSAIYPGNSIGTTMVVTERKPQAWRPRPASNTTGSLSTSTAPTRASGSKQLSARIASRLDSGLWMALGVQHQDSQGHPWVTPTRCRAPPAVAFAAPTTGTRSRASRYDRDSQGRRARHFGARQRPARAGQP